MEVRCRRHPEHLQSRGVCPYCLRERLHYLSASSSSATNTTFAPSTSTSSPASFASSLSYAATPPPHEEIITAAIKRSSLIKGDSLASILGIHKEEEKDKDQEREDDVEEQKEEDKEEKQEDEREEEEPKKKVDKNRRKVKKKGIFCTKMTRKGKTDDRDMRSKSLKEKLLTKWALVKDFMCSSMRERGAGKVLRGKSYAG